MGMFDEIDFEYPFPDPEFQKDRFQTHDLECMMETYRVDSEGRLWLKQWHTEPIPDAALPANYNELEGLEKLFAKQDMHQRVNDPDTLVPDMHGDIRICTSRGRSGADWKFYEWTVRFTHGKVEWIKPVEPKGD